MAEYKTPATEADFEANFAQIKPLMNANEAYYESGRCLFCYDAPCVNACPTSIDIPLFIRQINSGNASGAAKTIYDSNYFGNACGKVCPTEVLCEGACVYTNQGVKAIEIGRLQNFATDKVLKTGKPLYKTLPKNGKKVAIIGAGPAGISCACELSFSGYNATVFEAKSLPSGLTVHGVAPYKITNEEVLAEMDFLQKQFGFEIKYNSKIETAEDLQKLETEFDAVFIGVGLGKTASLQMPGENLENCLGAVEFIEQLRLNHAEIKVGEKVIVLGGGNTAMDAASESARMGAEEVVLAYRRDQTEMGAYAFEYELAKHAGVKGIFNVQPLEILGTDKVAGVKFIRTETLNGKISTIPGSEFILPCDMVIKATGQEKQRNLLHQISGLELASNGTIKINEATFQTTKPKYFAGGDAANGGMEVVNAANEGKRAAKGIHQFLTEKR
ncbi:NAD(P)-dependent oxidoreductase [Adhaeribacter sp. BT258]|uniref:NAD(P)-dependent oxidoreductase n=1 Tax=Adhaeribacter terrigena TaxID=2793070 RepID=A0ABS1C5C3_9BACT|nr:NAD(P)-dependent oxidoreductase [Adhaeribacter terrigena]MBK0403745.1 NAD(P)-dependent oxidoreductase [Adhaeribacter terrigena]